MKVENGGILGQLPDQEYIILETEDFVNIRDNKEKSNDLQIIIENYEYKELGFRGIGFLYISKDIVDKKDKYILSEEYDEKVNRYVFKLTLLDDGLRQFIEQSKWEAEMDEKDPFWYMKSLINDIEEKYGIKIDFDELLKSAKTKAEGMKLDIKNHGPTIENGRIVVGNVLDVLRKHDDLFDEKVSLSCEIAKLEEELISKCQFS